MDPARNLPNELPHDVDALKSLVLAQREQIISLSEEKQRLEHDNRLLFKLAFGKSTEKRSVAVSGDGSLQGSLYAKEIIAEASRLAQEHPMTDVAVEIQSTPRSRKKKGRRKTFPKHLPVVRTVCELAVEDRQCSCGGELTAFSEQVSRELERLETAIVHEIVQKKYACRSCEQTVKTAPWRGRVIEKGLLGPGYLAHVITERFGHHMPYYRLEKKYESEGLSLSRSVLCNSMARCAELLEPIAEELKREVLDSPVIHTDDTPVTVARSDTGGSRKGRIWVYLNPQGRHWYDFTQTHEREGPERVLGDYRGTIQADAYKGYDVFFHPDGATEAGCWAHTRRKFVDAESAEPEVAKEAIDRIRRLFNIEREADKLKLSPEARLTLRQKTAAPLVAEFGAWMEQAKLAVLPKGPLAKAITYATNQWGALNQYLKDGRVAISNNAAERGLRPVAVGRKNWMFFQRIGGGKTASILLSLLTTARAAEVDLQDYFRDVLLRISTCSDVSTLTPHGWKERWESEVTQRRQDVFDALFSGVQDS